MLHRNGKEIEQIFRNGREIALLYRNGKIIYDKRGKGPVTKTFQDLIDEGYVTVSRTWPNGNSYSAGWVGRAVGLTVAANCPYTLDQITDFDDIFNSVKMVSFDGVVGEGELPNAFLWPANHWLTDDEVYDLYNGVTLSHDVIAEQFKDLNWSNKPSVTIKYSEISGSWYFTDGGIFGANMPETVNFDVSGRSFSSTHDMFGRHYRSSDNGTNPMSNTVTFNWITTTNGGSNNTIRTSAGIFEGCSKLQTITGISFNNTNDISDAFRGCSSLETIPASLATNGMTGLQSMNYAFINCTSLQSIIPVLNVSNVSWNTDTFKNDVSLSTMSLYKINASKNKDWHLEDTVLNQASADYIVTNVDESVDTSVSGFVYKNIYFPAGVTITQAQASRLYQYGWNCYVDGQLINPSEFHISYVNDETSQDITGSLPANETVHSTSYTIPTSDLAWNEHGLLGYSETQYPAYADIATSVYAPGSTITLDHDMTLYPVWNTTFQGLINEGFVKMQTDLTYYNGSQPMRIDANHYPKELVTDFNDVFLSTNGKLVSNAGVVGEGTMPNSFIFDFNGYWLTNEEWYNLYNGTVMPHQPENNQFRNLDFSAYDSMEFKFEGPNRPGGGGGGSYRAFNFGTRSPEHLIIDVGSKQWLGFDKVVGYTSTAWAANMREITLRANGGNAAQPTILNAAFEECRRLKTINGLDISGALRLTYMFHNCIALETAPSTLSSTGETKAGNLETSYMFAGCTSLTSIGFIIDVSQSSKTTYNAFAGCSNLESVRLRGINAALNKSAEYNTTNWRYDWDFTSTKLDQTSADYMIANLVECDTNADGFTYKSIGFPSTVSLSNAQLIRLENNGWNVYVDHVQVLPTE